MATEYKDFCLNEYKVLFAQNFDALTTIKDTDKRRIEAQRHAIKDASVNAIKAFPDIEPREIWKTIYIAHVYNVSGIVDSRLIDSIISADNSWKKSSGHAFEEMIKELGNLSLKNHDIEIILQRDLNLLLKAQGIANEVRDISWLKEQVNSSVFDLYLTINSQDKKLVFGCIQSKTSIRDRVTRDREPSINAMSAFFLSIAIVLDGDFMKLPKFQHMVNGGSPDYELNGWHGMYILSNTNLENDRIHSTDISMSNFVSDVVNASEYWLTQRQWFNHKWKP
jgi:hypothetical protein